MTLMKLIEMIETKISQVESRFALVEPDNELLQTLRNLKTAVEALEDYALVAENHARSVGIDGTSKARKALTQIETQMKGE